MIEKWLDPINLVGMILVMFFIFVCLGRAAVGPSAPDRVAAINMIGTKTVVIIAFISFVFDQPYYLDVAMVYALISFIATIGVAKYMEKGVLD